MRKLHLSYKQGKEVLWNNKTIRMTQKSVVYYVYLNHNNKLEAKDWSGSIHTNLIITTDFDI